MIFRTPSLSIRFYTSHSSVGNSNG
uniref:Uncharacterized protein n=1 Tax=Arundo donax TaxID=35708 RepID=A0A0A8ZD35_ARUDO